MAAYLGEYFADKEAEIGRHIELELGIKLRQVGVSRYYINWEKSLKELAVSDFLDIITAAIRFQPMRRKYKDRTIVEYDLLAFTRRVFAEQSVAYQIDDMGGCHPLVDAAFAISTSGLIRNLTALELKAASEHILKAEHALLAGSYNGRQAIRSTFDAAENLAKLIFRNAIQLDKALIVSKLGPYLLAGSNAGTIERRASEKLVNALTDWVESAHFYRHASGDTEDTPPSEAYVLAFVSQGFSIIRWIADTYTLRKAIDE
jgi:hypothetical protein